MKIDLHIHTSCSDGKFTPFEIIDQAIDNNINIISITDHDTLSAYTKDLLEYAKEKNIKIVPGIEISTRIDKCGIHILGYNIDINNKTLNNRLKKIRNARHDYLFNVSKKLNELGYLVRTKKLDSIDAVTKAHIAEDIINNHKNKALLLREFGNIPSKGQFIERIMNEGCPAYVKKDAITPLDAANLIRKANGKVVLAHPVAYTYEDNLTIKEIQEIITNINADGIEAYYIYVDKNNNKHNDIDIWKNIAKENNIFVTIGSDYHNFNEIKPNIGLVNEELNIPEKEINSVLRNLI